MQNLFIPSIGTLLVLGEDWTFKLYFESRNNTLIKALYPKDLEKVNSNDPHEKWAAKYRGTSPKDFEGTGLLYHEKAFTEEQLQLSFSSYNATNKKDKPYLLVTLPEGTQLSVSRIYIRQGSEAFNSVTFRTNKFCPDKKFRSKRFWVKLPDANKIVCESII